MRASLYMLIFGGCWFVLLPMLLLVMGGEFPPSLRSLPWLVSGCALFLLGVSVSWFAAYHLVVYGRGTPFPLDPTRTLVTSGPYACVRNPQGIATALMVLGEIVAVKSNTLLWLLPITFVYLELLAAPFEHREMRIRHGEAYAKYQACIPKWIPRRVAGQRDSRA